MGEGGGVGGGDPARGPLVAGDTNPDHEVTSDAAANGVDDLEQETPAPLLVAAVLVGATVGER